EIPAVDIPIYWIRPQQILSAEKGAHRFLWDMHYSPLREPPSYPIEAIYEDTPPAETAPWAMPGHYIVKLTVDGIAKTADLALRMDPRVKTTAAGLQQQHDLSLACYEGRKKCVKAMDQINAYRSDLKRQLANSTTVVADFLNKQDSIAASLAHTTLANGIS